MRAPDIWKLPPTPAPSLEALALSALGVRLMVGVAFPEGPSTHYLWTLVPKAIKGILDSQVAGNNGPLYPKVDHHWFEVPHNYEPLFKDTGPKSH